MTISNEIDFFVSDLKSFSQVNQYHFEKQKKLLKNKGKLFGWNVFLL